MKHISADYSVFIAANPAPKKIVSGLKPLLSFFQGIQYFPIDADKVKRMIKGGVNNW